MTAAEYLKWVADRGKIATGSTEVTERAEAGPEETRGCGFRALCVKLWNHGLGLRICGL